MYLAEREGFEPSVGDTYTRFRDEPIQPLWHLSRQTFIVLESHAEINGDFKQKRLYTPLFVLRMRIHMFTENECMRKDDDASLFFGIIRLNRVHR